MPALVSFTLALALFGLPVLPAQDDEDLSILRIGEVIEEEITNDDPVVHTEILDADYAVAPVVGKTFRIEIEESGPYYIDLKSHYLDAYLVLRDAQGVVLAENDHGGISTHARIVIAQLDVDREYRVVASALYGMRGKFELRLSAGIPPSYDLPTVRLLELEEARERVEVTRMVRGEDSPYHAASLCALALILRDVGRFDEAYPHHERALAILEKTLGPESLFTIRCLRHVGLLLDDMSRYEDARPHLERAVVAAEKVYGPDHLETATCLNDLASVHLSCGDYRAALELCERSLAIQELAYDPEHPGLTTPLNNVGMLLLKLDRLEEAYSFFERALAIREKVLGPDDPDSFSNLSNMASLLKRMGRCDEAYPFYERALAVVEKARGPDHPETALGLANFGVFLEHVGRYREAREYHERALAIREKTLGPEHPETAHSLERLAAVHKAMGGYEEAYPLFQQALAIRMKAFGPVHPVTANAMNGVVSILYDLRRYEEALPLCERALAIREQTLGPEHNDTAESLNNLSSLRRKLGRYEEALPLWERTLAIREKVLGPDHPETAKGLNNLGSLLNEMGRTEEARSCLQRGLRILTKALGPGHRSTNLTRQNLAYLEASVGNHSLARELVLEVLETDRRDLADLLTTATEWEGPRAVHRLFWHAKFLLSVTRRMDSPQAERECYESVLTWKGMSSRLLSDSRARMLGQLDAEGENELAELRRTKAAISDEVYRTDEDDPRAHEQRLTALRKERSRLERSLLGRIRLDNVLARESLDALEKAVPEGTALIDFLVNNDSLIPATEESNPMMEDREPALLLTAWIVRADEPPRRVELGEARIIRKAVQEYLRALELGHRGIVAEGDVDSARLRESGRRLRSLLWDPLAEHLDEIVRVVVSPDHFLGSLPFGAIWLEDGRFLLEERSLVYLQDLSSLPEIMARAGAPDPLRGMLAVGGIDYSQRGLPSEAERDSDPIDVRGGVQRYWERLRYSGKEARTVASLARDSSGGECEVQELVGAAATEEAIKGSMPGCGWIHIATHGFFQSEELTCGWDGMRCRSLEEHRLRKETGLVTKLMPGLRTGLVCAGANLPTEEGHDNGLLTAEEVTWLDLLDCQLVVLSACETGLGESWGGNGLMSLQRAFRLAGARTVVSSLWNVDDESTSELMRGFYVNLWQSGMSKGDALREAQLGMLRRKRARNNGDSMPWTWGAFMLSGDWR